MAACPLQFRDGYHPRIAVTMDMIATGTDVKPLACLLFIWTTLDADTKVDIYEGVLETSAEDTKSSAGQFLTPRTLIKTMIACVAPEPQKAIADHACGTVGIFLTPTPSVRRSASPTHSRFNGASWGE